jgi:cob(I)alamin adenosyltransferase
MLTPAFQPRRAVTVKWGSLPGHSCGTAPDSHRRSLRCAAHHSQRRLGALGPTLRLVARGESIVLLNTGHGKGKSSAAFGVMARGWARGWRVGVVQFVKGGKWKTGERKLADHLGVEWHTLGDGFTWESTDLDETAAKGRHAWDVAAGKLASGDFDLLILDELTYAVKYEWVPVDEVVAGIRDRAEGTNVVMTGRDAADELVELADTVTEMRKVKHAYDRGIKGKKGIEY